MDEHLWAIKELVNSNQNLFRTPKLVAEMLKDEWFEIQNPEIMDMTTAEMVEKWIKIIWINAEWLQKDITFMPDWNFILHVNHPAWVWTPECNRLQKQFEKQVARLIWDLTSLSLAPRYVQTKRSWIWTWEVKKETVATQDDSNQWTKTSKPNKLTN